MESLHNEQQRNVLMKFFKTGPGEYGEGDEFLGLKVPQTREVVRHAADLPLTEIPDLLMSRWHEVRLCGFLLLVSRFGKLSTKRLTEDEQAVRKRDDLVRIYLDYADRANNWDLVDLSAPKIIGHWLLLPSNVTDKTAVIDSLAFSQNLWHQRISMVCTWKTTQAGDPTWCLRYAEIHLRHTHDLMQKATGWMLRELGKRISMDMLRDFLTQHVHEMPRTTLRYAIEKMSPEERLYWMKR
jgi:3-methyladenine DNA glycosylase AlkD